MTEISGPAALLARLPALLGRTPGEEVLLVGLNPGQSPGAAVFARILLTDAVPGMLWPACVTAHAAVRAEGASEVVIVAYADDSAELDAPAALVAAALTVLAEQDQLPVRDALRVVDGRWWSYECADPSCCPPEGKPITTEENPTP